MQLNYRLISRIWMLCTECCLPIVIHLVEIDSAGICARFKLGGSLMCSVGELVICIYYKVYVWVHCTYTHTQPFQFNYAVYARYLMLSNSNFKLFAFKWKIDFHSPRYCVSRQHSSEAPASSAQCTSSLLSNQRLWTNLDRLKLL